jgi:zinc protease
MRGNRRLAPPSPALVQLMELDQAMAVYRHRFGDASQFTFVIVGAAKPERVKPLVERYLASLPSTGRAEREQPKDPGTPVWTSNSRSFNERGTLPRASLHVVFDSIFTTEPQEYARERQRLTTLTWVIHRRLRERLREERGMTYSPVAQSQMYTSPKEHFRISIQADAAPEDIDEVETVVDQVLDSLRSHGATASELATVAAIQQRSLQTQLLSNQYWLGAIQQHDRLSVPLDQIVDSHPDVLTPADIRAAAQRYLPRNAFMKQIVIPERKEEDKAEES